MKKVPMPVVIVSVYLNALFFIAISSLYELAFFNISQYVFESNSAETFNAINGVIYIIRDDAIKLLVLAYILTIVIVIVSLLKYLKDKILAFQIHKVLLLSYIFCGIIFFGIFSFSFGIFPLFVGVVIWLPFFLIHRFYAHREFKGMDVEKIFE